MTFFEASSRSGLSLEHGLFRKPASSPDQVRARPFRDHALALGLADRPDRLRPERHVGRDGGGKFFRRAAERLEPVAGETFDEFLILDGAANFRGDAIDDVA